MSQDQFHQLTVSGVRAQPTRPGPSAFELPDALKSDIRLQARPVLTVRAKSGRRGSAPLLFHLLHTWRWP